MSCKCQRLVEVDKVSRSDELLYDKSVSSDWKFEIRIFSDFKLVSGEVWSGGVACEWWLMGSDSV